MHAAPTCLRKRHSIAPMVTSLLCHNMELLTSGPNLARCLCDRTKSASFREEFDTTLHCITMNPREGTFWNCIKDTSNCLNWVQLAPTGWRMREISKHLSLI